MTLRLSALFENKLDELLVNFYRHRSGSGRRTRQRSRRAVENEPGTSGVSSPARRVTPRARPETTPRVSTRVSASRRRDDDEGPSTSDGLRMKISLTKGSVLSTTGLEDTERGNSSAVGTSTRQQTNHLDDLSSQRARTRSAARTSFRESVSSTSSIVSETPDMTVQNGPSRSRYSTRSRVPPTRLQLNGESADHESEDDDEEEEEEEEEASEESEDETSEESDSPQHGINLRSNRSGKAPMKRTNSSTKSGSGGKGKGKQVVNSKRPVRTRASSRYDDSASESDGDSADQQLDVSSRGRVRRKAFKMLDYVN